MLQLHRNRMVFDNKPPQPERIVIDPFQLVAVSEQLNTDGEGDGTMLFLRSGEVFWVTESFDEVMTKIHECHFPEPAPEDI
jgi:hypothetical protein